MSNDEEKEEERGYKRNDKRKIGRESKPAEPQPLGDNAGVYIPSDPEPEQQEGIDFGSFIISLGHNAYVSMGKVVHPETGETYENLENAQQMIDILEMLDKKTKGNLEPEEDRLLTGLLYELRMAFVELNAQKV